MRKQLYFFLLLFMITLAGYAQSDSTSHRCKIPFALNVGTDIMSRYVWRGTDFGNSPSIQPTLSFSVGNFEVGAWGAIATNSFYKEIDLYAKYSLKNFSVTFTDYYVPSVTAGVPSSPDTRFSIYHDKLTCHSLEGSLQYKRTEKIPLWISGSVFFYGNDKRWGYDAKKDTTDKTYYSSYFEAGYSFRIKKNTADVFVGFTPMAGAYGNTAGVVNAGITGSRRIQITDEFAIPVKASLIVNPQTSNIYFLFGITL
jgi:hypothetical protein